MIKDDEGKMVGVIVATPNVCVGTMTTAVDKCMSVCVCVCV